MYFRKKISGGRVYLQIAESRRVGGRVRQRVIATLGRLDALAASGQLERLLRSGARFATQAVVLSAAQDDATAAVWRIGPALVFERLWSETGCRAVPCRQTTKMWFPPTSRHDRGGIVHSHPECAGSGRPSDGGS